MIVSVVVFIICVGILLAFSGDQLDCQSMTKLLVGIIAIGTGAFFTRRHFARELERLNRETLPEEVKDAVIKAKPSYLGFLAFGPLLLGIFLASHNSGTGYDTPFVVFFIIVQIICWIYLATRPTPPPKCPKCNSEDIFIERTSSGSYETTETKTRVFTHYNSDGDETGHTETEYEAPVTRDYTTNYYKCKACDHKWSR